ncbi:hypothetical protein ANCDUO_22174 [Ancylostoma duodenale]|uniref:Uncharacterized protein n=1 Tax=Ancylostoma duodenale TaxID=51022 RepID=A0A0C2FS55_9BILA|nr:hypothetical protein ANCDUO_22174 [Ancylostoma duodenale]
MEQLLERQWEQGSQFLISQAQFDVAQLLTCLHQLKSENIRLEEQLVQLNRRREHLLSLTSRLSPPVVPPQPQPPPPPTASLVSPHHSPIVPASSSVSGAAVGGVPSAPGGVGVEDSLTQLRSLASGTPRPSVRPPSQASSVPSTSSFTSTQPSGAGFVPHVQNR